MKRIRSKFIVFIKSIYLYIFLGFGVFILVYPYLWMLSSAFKTEENFYMGGLGIIPNPPSTYIWKYLFIDISVYFPIVRFILNSILITFGAILICLISAVFGGYALARKPVMGKKAIVLMLLATLMLPSTALILPLYFVISRLNLINTYLGITLAISAYPLPFLILYRFFRELPVEFEDAAKVDGATDLNILLSIIIPLSMPAILCASLLSFIQSWSVFIEPYILSTTEKWYTLPVSLIYFMRSSYGAQTHALFVVSTIATFPAIIVFIITQRSVFEGFAGGLKR